MAFYYLSQRCAVRPRVQPDSENEGQGHEILEIFLINSKFFCFAPLQRASEFPADRQSWV